MKKNKFLYFLIALLIAFGMWAYVVTTVSPESEATFYNIAVDWDSESEAILKDKGLIVVSGKPTVTLKLRGNRSDLNSLKNSDITVIADLTKINATGEQPLNYSVYFTGGKAFEIVSQTPSALTLQIAEWATKDVPVEVKYDGSVGSDYIAFTDDVIPNPAAITITGPKSVVDQVAQAKVTVDLTDQTESISQSYRATLCNSDGEPMDVSTITADGDVRVTLRILRVKEIQIKVNANYTEGSGVTAENSTLTQDYYSIKVAGSEKILAALPDVLEVGTVNVSDYTENTVVTLPITAGMLQGAENLTGIAAVKVSVTVPERITRELYISADQIQVNNLPEGMKLEPVTQNVTVTLIGWEDRVNAIDAEDVMIVIDASDAEINDNQNFTAGVILSPGTYGVEAKVEHSITVNITEDTSMAGGES